MVFRVKFLMQVKHVVCTDQLFCAGKRTWFGLERTRRGSEELKWRNLIRVLAECKLIGMLFYS